MGRRKLQIGDVFEIALGVDRYAYFQWIAIDEYQLQSDVIRVFSCSEEQLGEELERLESRDILFHAHCVIPVGIRFGVWKKVGSLAYPTRLDVLFCSSRDFGRDEIVTSDQWDVWRVNEPPQFIGRLHGEFISAEPGEVFPPAEILYRIEHGTYQQPYQK